MTNADQMQVWNLHCAAATQIVGREFVIIHNLLAVMFLLSSHILLPLPAGPAASIFIIMYHMGSGRRSCEWSAKGRWFPTPWLFFWLRIIKVSIAAACTQNMLELMFSPSFFLIGICEDTLVPEGEPKRLPEEIHACETTCSNDGLQAPALAYEVCVCVQALLAVSVFSSLPSLLLLVCGGCLLVFVCVCVRVTSSFFRCLLLACLRSHKYCNFLLTVRCSCFASVGRDCGIELFLSSLTFWLFICSGFFCKRMSVCVCMCMCMCMSSFGARCDCLQTSCSNWGLTPTFHITGVWKRLNSPNLSVAIQWIQWCNTVTSKISKYSQLNALIPADHISGRRFTTQYGSSLSKIESPLQLNSLSYGKIIDSAFSMVITTQDFGAPRPFCSLHITTARLRCSSLSRAASPSWGFLYVPQVDHHVAISLRSRHERQSLTICQPSITPNRREHDVWTCWTLIFL
jgi:hypothetical protein